MRLALADHPGDKDSNKLLGETAPWSARLAARLLREEAAGDASAWRPYLDVLPSHIETPVHWGWDLICKLRYQPAADHLHESHWVVQNALRNLSGRAIGLDYDELNDDDVERFRSASPGSLTFVFSAMIVDRSIPFLGCMIWNLVPETNHKVEQPRHRVSAHLEQG
jgi:hypothetical protein